jgi:hypothetical protein
LSLLPSPCRDGQGLDCHRWETVCRRGRQGGTFHWTDHRDRHLLALDVDEGPCGHQRLVCKSLLLQHQLVAVAGSVAEGEHAAVEDLERRIFRASLALVASIGPDRRFAI